MNSTTTTYRGSCHCGAVRFEFRSEPITDAMQCNCSICIRKNAIMSKHKFTPDEFTLLSGKEDLSLYLWNDKDVNHFFCKHCGIFPFSDTLYEPGTYRINYGCVEGIEPRSLAIDEFDGRHLL